MGNKAMFLYSLTIADVTKQSYKENSIPKCWGTLKIIKSMGISVLIYADL